MSISARDDQAQVRDGQSARHASDLEPRAIDRSTLDDDVGNEDVTSDLWTAAFREAVNSLGTDIDVAILKGKNVEQLFRELVATNEEATQESVFLRGMNYLRSIQVPLERFKLVLDLASPLAYCEPTATMVFGVVKGVTAVSSSP